jgi:hypothetical protein
MSVPILSHLSMTVRNNACVHFGVLIRVIILDRVRVVFLGLPRRVAIVRLRATRAYHRWDEHQGPTEVHRVGKRSACLSHSREMSRRLCEVVGSVH